MSSPRGTLLLTGANGGLATGFISQFLKSPHATSIKGYYTVHNPAKATNLRTTLERAPKSHEYEIATMDMSSLKKVRQAAEDINKQVANGTLHPIQALVLNAGIQDTHEQNFTDDGIEQTFAVNYLHNFLLVLLLIQSMDKEHGRIVIISSTSIYPDWWPNKDNYPEESQKTFFTSVEQLARGEASADDAFRSGLRRYAMSKVMMIMFMYELQRRLNDSPSLSSISILGLDPGWVTTEIGRNSPFVARAIMQLFQVLAPPLSLFWPNIFVRTAKKTGDDLLRVCFDNKKFGEHPKAAYVDGSELGEPSEESKDSEKAGALWKGSLKWAGIKEGDTVLENWK
ncbi:NAD(P)-binding protein [Tothia fuscella]|uniref:NAD(P)-binding protein n=1 Tax=Tothia fuscella TaxID=1048955 RepID=A0A9P4P297_9PEZI|nr:NAD(P)-binding protein [Tothia fuscella]